MKTTFEKFIDENKKLDRDWIGLYTEVTGWKLHRVTTRELIKDNDRLYKRINELNTIIEGMYRKLYPPKFAVNQIIGGYLVKDVILCDYKYEYCITEGENQRWLTESQIEDIEILKHEQV